MKQMQVCKPIGKVGFFYGILGTYHMKQEKIFDPDIEANKAFAAMSYIWALCLVPLLLRRKSKFAQFHAKQGFVLFLLELVAALLSFVPLLGQLLAFACIIMAALGFLNAYGGKWVKLPFLYHLSEKIKL